MTTQSLIKYEKFVELKKKIADVGNLLALAHWDLETYIPEGATNLRSQQIQTLSGILHELSTSVELEALLNDLNALIEQGDKELTKDEEACKNIEISLEDFNKNKKYSTDFVQRLSKASSEGTIAWQKAKKNNDFSIFAPYLKVLIELKKEEAKLLGANDSNKNSYYSVLINEYEPGMTVEILDKIFEGVREKLVPFIKQLQDLKRQPKDSFLMGKFKTPQDKIEFSRKLVEEIGFDFNKGRLDVSSHPFTTSFGPSDVRITTRAKTLGIMETLLSTIHEAGHGLYEQGFKETQYGLPLGQAISFGIHESQSLIWERCIGRSETYWKRVYEMLKSEFPDEFNTRTDIESKVYFDSFYKAINRVEPSFIRTEADELTYHLHILIRYEIEKEILLGDIDVNDIPALWNKKYKDYLGLEVLEDSMGCLQDVHWSHGSFGYFPSYSLGSFYAVQFFEQARKDIENFDSKIEKGEFKEFKTWLNTKIHQVGRKFTAEELCKEITGEPLNFDVFMNYYKDKYKKIYSLS